MNNNENEVLNQFNTNEFLDLSDPTGSGDTPLEEKQNEAVKKSILKKKLRTIIFGSVAVVAVAVAVTAIVLNINDPNGYDKGSSQFVTDSDSLSVTALSDNVIGTGIMYELAMVYDSTSSDAKIVATLRSGDDVLIYGVSGDYFKVSNAQKTIEGYVRRDSVNTGGIEIGGPSDLPVTEVDEETTDTNQSNKKKTDTTKNKTNSTVKPEDFPVNSSPYFIYVEKGSHTITIYTKDSNGKYTVPKATYSTATGRTSGLTPVGNFSILAHEAWHTWSSTSYSPYCSKYSGNLYFHGAIYKKKGDFSSLNEDSVYDIGKNATSGCMRTSVAAAYAIYNCPVGTNVKIVNGSPLGRSASRPSVESQYIDPMQKTVAVNGISFDFTQVTVKIDESVTAKVLFEPADATNRKCTWSVSDPKVAEKEESEDGASCKLTGKKAGSVTVTAISEDGKYKAQFTLIVKGETTTTKATTASTTEKTEATTQETSATTTTESTTEATDTSATTEPQPTSEETTEATTQESQPEDSLDANA